MKGAAKAARIQAKTAAENRQMYENMVNQYTQDVSPYTTAGTNAINAQENLLGLNGAAGTGAQQQAFDNFNNSTGYQFGLNQGLNAVNSNAYAAGDADSGATLRALQDRGSQLANEQFGTYYNDLNGLGSQGLSAYSGLANMMNSATNGETSSNTAAANARSSGILGQTSAYTNALNSVLGSGTQLAGALSNQSSYGGSSNPFEGAGTTAGGFTASDFS